MAVEAVAAWYEMLRETQDLQDSINDEKEALSRRFMQAEGLSEPELSVEMGKIEEDHKALSARYVRLENDTPPMPDLSGMTEAERVAAAERLRNDDLRYARRLQAKGDARGPQLEALARIVDFDPKQEGLYYSRYTRGDLTKFDLDEESPIGPMIYIDSPYKSESDFLWLSRAVNFLSVKIASSDVGFPIHVYGTVIVRDSMDERCVYHFRRDSDHCQLINSEAESLTLTGPKRGLALCDDIFVETDLKMKDHLRRQERELSKGLVIIRNTSTGPLATGYLVQTKSLATRLSTVDLTYMVVDRAMEGVIAVEVLQGGCFLEKITAVTSSRQDIVLYDSKEADDGMTVDDCGDIQLMRHVVSVCVNDLLFIVARTIIGKSERIPFTPIINGRDVGLLTVGATKMRVKLSWSVIRA